MRLVLFGSPQFALPALGRLAVDTELVLVVSQPDRPVGRRQEVRGPPVVEAARALGLPLIQPRNPNADEVVSRIRAARPDVLVTIAYGRLIGPALLALCPAGVVNLHPSLLPEYRGASPIQAALCDGRAATGVTLIRSDEGLDTGPIIAAREAPIGPHDTAPDLRDRLAELGADLLAETLPAWVDGTIEAQPQDGASATATRPLKRADGELDVRRSAQALYDQWRAFEPWPATSVTAGDLRCKLLEVRADPEPAGPAGTVTVTEGSLRLACGEGSLRITAIQPEGRRRMTGAEFASGYGHLLRVPWGRPYPAVTDPLVRPAAS